MHVFGIYARTNNGGNIGSLIKTSDGDRILAYAHKVGGKCSIRLGVTRENGWQPGKAPTSTAHLFISRFISISIRNLDGNVIVNGSLGSTTVIDGGVLRSAHMECSKFDDIYKNPKEIKYIILES